MGLHGRHFLGVVLHPRSLCSRPAPTVRAPRDEGGLVSSSVVAPGHVAPEYLTMATATKGLSILFYCFFYLYLTSHL